MGLNNEPNFEAVQLYDITQATPSLQQAYISTVNSRLKIYKNIFEVYSKRSMAQQKGFSNKLQVSAKMEYAMIFKFLSDFKLAKSQFKTREHYKNVVKKINELQDT